ncbi:MAG TPA: HAMP domain-containing sensor histidine kinase [Elusimicrobiota bacterium]|nr:HAMP domain-containing sensor histidine kinase [Elusimicrobiota bacterium]
MKRIPIYAQILGGFLALQGAVLAATLSAVYSQQSRQVLAEIDGRIQATRSNLEGKIASNVQGVKSALLNFQSSIDLSNPNAIVRMLLTTLPQLAQTWGSMPMADSKVEFYVISDAAGQVKESTLEAMPVGSTLMFWPEFERAVKSAEVVHKARFIGDTAYRTCIAPFKVPQPGFLAAGVRMSGGTRENGAGAADYRIALALDGKLLPSDLPSEDAEALQAAMGAIKPGAQVFIGPRGRRSVVSMFSIPDEGEVYILQDWDKALGPVKALRRRLLLIGLAGMAATALLGFLIAKGIARSTQQLIDKLSELNEIKSKFFMMFTHDMGSPMSVLISGTELLKDGLQGPQAEAMMRSIIASANAIRFLTSDLMDVAAMEAGKLRVTRRPIDLRAVLAEIGLRIAPLAKKRGIAFSIAPGDGALAVNGDPQRLMQVLQNLCGNALQYTPQGGSVEVSAAADGELARVSVKDSGIGLDPKDAARVFETFFQAKNGRELRPGGLGLGLSIAKEILQAHGGSIGVRSALGKGSTFYFTVPLLAPQEAAQVPADQLRNLAPPQDAVQKV